jgi:uncharacterized protein (TIGR00369 family)
MAKPILDLVRGDLQRLIAHVPHARLLDMTVVDVRPGECWIRMPYSKRLIGNPETGVVHGGVIGAFLEMAAIFQLMSESEGDHLPKPVNFTIEYLRSAGPRDAFAQATVTKLGRRVANVSVRAWQDEPDRPVASAQGHFLMSQAP